ncbi:alpha/beta hydrolase [Rhodococcus sp. (in: high G+C Gram-positive bacteria)]|uniref:alpha/beta hydrolase n=1 Tax=Rhodococcus sp. TaxID=1831 RepID=UPI00388DF901
MTGVPVTPGSGRGEEGRATSAVVPPERGSRRSRALAAVLAVSARILADVVPLGRVPLGGLRLGLSVAGRLDLARGTRVERDRTGPVPGRWVVPTGTGDSPHVLYYLHGGGFVMGSSASHVGVAARIARAAGVPAFLPDYRRAPEAPFPAAPDDVRAGFDHLRKRGYAARDIVIAGDSAGGHLAYGLVVELDRDGADLPAGVALVSPWLDLWLRTGWEREAARRDPFLSVKFADRARCAYAPDGDPADPRLDLLAAAPGSHWPPFFIQGGETEAITGDTQALKEALAAAGVSHELQIWPGQVHVWHAFHPLVPEAAVAARLLGHFVRDALARKADSS